MGRSPLVAALGPLGRFAASQLASPKGLWGRIVTTRMLNLGNRRLILTTLDALAPTAGDRLLDVGFGGGLALDRALDRGVRQAVGVDPSADCVAAMTRRRAAEVASGALRLAVGPVERLPLATGSVDALLSTNTVYFWPDLGQAFAELHRVLRKGGRLALGFSGSGKLRQFGVITRHGFVFHETDEIADRLAGAGFDAVTRTDLHGGTVEGDVLMLARGSGGPDETPSPDENIAQGTK